MPYHKISTPIINCHKLGQLHQRLDKAITLNNTPESMKRQS